MPIPAEQKPMVRTTARERVYKTLQQWIINGTLLPEERLNDVELAQYFSVSRTPVREALQMLAEQKLVTTVPSSGTFVAPIDTKDLTYVYELLNGLQCYAIDLGIGRMTEDIAKDMHRINDTFLQYASKGEAGEAITADWNLHHRIAELSENPYLISYTEQLMLQAHRNEIHFFKTRVDPRHSFDAHNRIISALERDDAAAAKAAVCENWRVSIR
mgnify:CR=1 FL=1